MNTIFPFRLQELIEKLDKINEIDGFLLSDLLAGSEISAADLEPFATFDHSPSESYGRKLLYENGRFKILLMSWLPGDFTAIHNHGTSEWGSVRVFGSTSHRLYQFDNQILRLIEADTYPNGHVTTVFGDLIHMMGNSGSKSFTSLHVYGSNSKNPATQENAKIYIPELKRVVETAGEAFLSLKRELILSESEFTGFDPDAMADYLKLVKPFYIRNNKIEILDRVPEYHHQTATC